jgi:hypothetical protein
MQHEPSEIFTLAADTAPPELTAWIDGQEQPALLVSVERLTDGRVVFQTMPGVDPAFVARLRKILAQHADVLRRLT